MNNIKFKPVESSNIKELGYDEAERVLYIKFNSGGLYSYSDVSQDEYLMLISAESVGKMFYKLGIKPRGIKIPATPLKPHYLIKAPAIEIALSKALEIALGLGGGYITAHADEIANDFGKVMAGAPEVVIVVGAGPGMMKALATEPHWGVKHFIFIDSSSTLPGDSSDKVEEESRYFNIVEVI